MYLICITLAIKLDFINLRTLSLLKLDNFKNILCSQFFLLISEVHVIYVNSTKSGI